MFDKALIESQRINRTVKKAQAATILVMIACVLSDTYELLKHLILKMATLE